MHNRLNLPRPPVLQTHSSLYIKTQTVPNNATPSTKSLILHYEPFECLRNINSDVGGTCREGRGENINDLDIRL